LFKDNNIGTHKPYVSEEKIHVFCLSIVKKSMPSKIAARRKLALSQKEFIVLQFGFINGYKGIDWAIKALTDIKPGKKGQKIRYLVAGGPNPYLKSQPFYTSFYHTITKSLKQYAHMTHAGFIPEEDIKRYYAAADVVIMPYEVFMSASGPFSQALAHGKPLILSESLLLYARSEDFKQAMHQANLSKEELFFPLQKKRLQSLIHKAQTNPAYRKRLTKFSVILREKRSSINIMRHLYSVIVPEKFQYAAYRPTLSIQN
jgi:hypothetical protein